MYNIPAVHHTSARQKSRLSHLNTAKIVQTERNAKQKTNFLLSFPRCSLSSRQQSSANREKHKIIRDLFLIPRCRLSSPKAELCKPPFVSPYAEVLPQLLPPQLFPPPLLPLPLILRSASPISHPISPKCHAFCMNFE